MNAKDILKRIRAAFDAPAAPGDVAPPDTTAMTMFSYPIDGGSTIYVDCSDDGMADIDSGDNVYSDPAMTVPYADGTYTVTGTQFGFTVAGGVVSSVADGAGTGPGLPLEQAAAAETPPPATTPPTPPAANGMEQRLAAIEAELAKMRTPVTQGAMATAEELKLANQKIEKSESTITSMFELLEKLVEIPTADPKTLTGARKEKFDKLTARDERLNKFAEALKKNKALA